MISCTVLSTLAGNKKVSPSHIEAKLLVTLVGHGVCIRVDEKIGSRNLIVIKKKPDEFLCALTEKPKLAGLKLVWINGEKPPWINTDLD